MYILQGLFVRKIKVSKVNLSQCLSHIHVLSSDYFKFCFKSHSTGGFSRQLASCMISMGFCILMIDTFTSGHMHVKVPLFFE